ncbi:hypothetical protein BKA65DRAFT_580218 [Rhexocercosporidium sp. MPI-PUGE-AT-0058]|nr:hypothetical protein BKA65DRAFT_580218 [Rhexocercosporidium sp. MPI-PUGE-AT-0058]
MGYIELCTHQNQATDTSTDLKPPFSLADISTQKYNKLARKHVLIFGGTSGLGYAVAEASIESNACVTISSSSSWRIQNTITSLKETYPSAEVTGYPCDLSKATLEADLETLFQQVGKVDRIIFTAGESLKVIPLNEATLESIMKAGQVRFFAPLLVAKVGSKYLEKSTASSIVLTTGSVAQKPIPGWSILSSYKAGLQGMTRGLAIDLKPIRVNVVSPGPVDSELWDFMGEGEKAFLDGMAENFPTGHVGRPEELAEAYLWLMKDSNVTGFVAYSDSGLKLV